MAYSSALYSFHLPKPHPFYEPLLSIFLFSNFPLFSSFFFASFHHCLPFSNNTLRFFPYVFIRLFLRFSYYFWLIWFFFLHYTPTYCLCIHFFLKSRIIFLLFVFRGKGLLYSLPFFFDFFFICLSEETYFL